MAEEKDIDLSKVLEGGTKKMNLADLQQRGFKSVKVLDEKAMEDLVRKAVDRVVSTQTADEKARFVEASRKELERLMKEHKAARSRAQLLEVDKNELVEQVESLQRELELKSDLEEELLHKKFEEGTASMQAQVEEVKRRAQAADDELGRLRTENARLEATLEAEREKVARSRELETRLDAALKDVQDLNRQNARYQTELEGAGRRLNELENGLDSEKSRLREAEHARTEMVEQVLKLQAQGSDAARLARDLDAARAALAKAEALVGDAAKENSALKARGVELENRVQEAQLGLNQATAEAARLEGENGALRKEAPHSRAAIAALEAGLTEERSKLQAGASEAATLRERLDRAHAEIKSLEKDLNEERSKSQIAAEDATSLRGRLEGVETRGWDTQTSLDRALARATELEKKLAGADRLELDRVHLQQELDRVRAEVAGLDALRQERDAATAALQEAKDEAASLRADLARQEREQESQREKTIIVTSEIEEIEEKRNAEQQELEGLRQVSKALEEQLAKTRQDLAQAHLEMQSLQEILQREQDVSRDVHNESTAAQAKLQELTSSTARLDEHVRSLADENRMLLERLKTAESATALDERLAALDRLIGLARQSSGVTRASVAESREVTDLLRKTLLMQGRPKRKRRGASLQGGVALDGHALLQEFFRRIRLKERLQKHVPVREKDGQRHPSELLVDVVSALIAGDRRAAKEKGAKLEILGPSRGPDVADLRQFLGRVSPRASHAVARVHDALRHNLFSMPEKPARLILDVGSVDLARSYRPLVAYEPGSKEFWHGELRTVQDKDTRGIVPFLKECVSKVPGGFARSRVRFRLDSRYFSEDVIRFLNRRGCSYVMAAPDLAAVREAAKKAKFHELSGGWEAGEFLQRIHPIRKTMARYVVARHRLSRKGRPEAAQFRDKTYEYCVFVADAKISPWRAYQTWAGRPASQAESASQLSDFTRSRLMGKRRRSHGALFPLYLLASDLVQWFRRKALPMDERGRDLESLRTELLKLPTTQERMGLTRLPVLPKRDKHRKSFERVTRKIRRLRPVKAFKFRK
jgi:chromosome segregation ATPase